ncbi:NAD(P)H-dependent oxidoreductase [Flavobacteriaceae bacterium]|nr:NAD(P)H-dependent oxidoreductase [Flavobacteriaceae bacterium]
MSFDILKKLEWRYATKKFDATKKVSSKKITILKEAFNLTATSYGLQPLKLVVISNPKIIKDLVPLSYNQGQVGNASHIFVICIETSIDAKFIKKYFDLVNKTRNTSRDILKSYEDYLIDNFSKKTDEEITIWAAKQAYLTMGNLLTVCAVEEIDACPIEGFQPDQYDSYLNLSAKGLQSVLVMAVGHRSVDDAFSELKKVRRGVDEIVIDLE